MSAKTVEGSTGRRDSAATTPVGARGEAGRGPHGSSGTTRTAAPVLPPPVSSVRSLFRSGAFTLHAGNSSDFKIDCDALTDDDWVALAMMIARVVGPFSAVEGVPTGGVSLARALGCHVSDVRCSSLTTC